WSAGAVAAAEDDAGALPGPDRRQAAAEYAVYGFDAYRSDPPVCDGAGVQPRPGNPADLYAAVCDRNVARFQAKSAGEAEHPGTDCRRGFGDAGPALSVAVAGDGE